jgi:hypothetical protein
VLNHQGAEGERHYACQSPARLYNTSGGTNPVLCPAELIRSCAQRDYPALAEVFKSIAPDRVDVALFIRGNNAHLSFVGAFRSISFPRFPGIIAAPPDIARIARVLAEVAR